MATAPKAPVEMQSEKVLPFDWEGFDIQDAMCFSFYGARWREAFGPFKAGEVIKCLTVDYSEGTVTDEDSKKQATFRAAVV